MTRHSSRARLGCPSVVEMNLHKFLIAIARFFIERGILNLGDKIMKRLIPGKSHIWQVWLCRFNTTAVMLGLVAIASCSRISNKSAESSTSPTADWAAIAKLPDWTGSWQRDDLLAKVEQGIAVGEALPFTPEAGKVNTAAAEMQRDHPGSNRGNSATCTPVGMPGILEHPMQFEFLFAPGRVTMLFEDGEVRRIFTDGRKHPEAYELYDGFSGHSIGHWEGDTLVVDTLGMNLKAEVAIMNTISDYAVSVTKSTHVVERMSLKSKDQLQIDTVVTDPELFTKPLAYSRTYERSEDTFDAGCTNNRESGSGDADLTLPAT